MAGADRNRMTGSRFSLTMEARRIVAATIADVCAFRGWRLLRLSVDGEHVHVVIIADRPPEQVMVALKAWATRRLIEAGHAEPGERVWAKHGSTRKLWTLEAVEEARTYVKRQSRPHTKLDTPASCDLNMSR